MNRCYECDEPARYIARLTSDTTPEVKLCVDCAADARDRADVVWIVGLLNQGEAS